ncbi:MAG TPA: thioesterase family protein [Desulfitobacteriaceae bacterium]|nr:thioesterase family protein [Desulfitobacteriaceae bacterium]
MKDSLKPGLEYEFKFKIPENKTVPYLFAEAAEFQVMPKVLATGFMVGLFEWACIKALTPHLDWPEEQSVGTAVNISHTAATPPGFTVTVKVRLEKVEGKKLLFQIESRDDLDQISTGTHERFIINAAKFNANVDKKAKSLNP